jgi:hypothetical protein
VTRLCEFYVLLPIHYPYRYLITGTVPYVVDYRTVQTMSCSMSSGSLHSPLHRHSQHFCNTSATILRPLLSTHTHTPAYFFSTSTPHYFSHLKEWARKRAPMAQIKKKKKKKNNRMSQGRRNLRWKRSSGGRIEAQDSETEEAEEMTERTMTKTTLGGTSREVSLPMKRGYYLCGWLCGCYCRFFGRWTPSRCICNGRNRTDGGRAFG